MSTLLTFPRRKVPGNNFPVRVLLSIYTQDAASVGTAAQIAEALGGRAEGDGFKCCCPAHEDSTPSLSTKDSKDGKVLFHCYAGCPQDKVLAALKQLGLWKSAPPKGCTLVAIAEAKQLPVEALKAAGWRDSVRNNIPAVEIPYRAVSGGQILATQVRLALTGDNMSMATLFDGPPVTLFEGGSRFRFRAVVERMGTGTGYGTVAA